MSGRKDTKLASSGSEFLVLGELLIREIESYKTYNNHRAYDVICVNPSSKKMQQYNNGRLQVNLFKVSLKCAMWKEEQLHLVIPEILIVILAIMLVELTLWLIFLWNILKTKVL